MAYPCDVGSQRTGPDRSCRYNRGDRRPVGTPGRDLMLAVITRVASRRWTYRGGQRCQQFAVSATSLSSIDAWLIAQSLRRRHG